MKIDHKESYEDFGDQFLVDSNVDDYWGSDEMLQDIVHPLDLSSIEDKIVMEVGSGSGRIIKNLLKYNPKLIISVEPSEAINVAKLNNKHASHKISFKQIKCEELDLKNEVDFCFSLGVIHHIPNAEVAVVLWI